LIASINIWVAHCQTRPMLGSALSKPKYCRAPILITGFDGVEELILLERGGERGEGGGRSVDAVEVAWATRSFVKATGSDIQPERQLLSGLRLEKR